MMSSETNSEYLLLPESGNQHKITKQSVQSSHNFQNKYLWT